MKGLLSGPLVAVLLLAAGCPRNHPPDKPSVPIGPASGYPDSGYQITTVGHDPDGDGVAVRFSWGDDDTSAWSNLAANWSSFAGTHSWDSLGTYFVTAQASDEHADCSDWSGELEVAIVTANPPPDVPAVPSGQGDCIVGRTYIFTTSGADPNGDRLQFRFSWGDSDTTDWTELVPSRGQGSAKHSWSNTGTYRVKSQARDEHGAASDWSGELVVTVWDSTGGAPGTVKWEFAAEAGIASSPAIGADGTIYVGSYDHKLYAVSPDGMLKWEFLTGGPVKSSPAVGADGTVYVGSDDNKVCAIDPGGTLKWTFATRWDVISSPAVGTDGTIYVGSRDGSLYAIYQDGALRWEFVTRGEVLSSPAVGTDGTIYVGSRDSSLYAVKPDGTKKWEVRVGSSILNSSPAIGQDGTIYVGSCEDGLHAINADGSRRWEFRIPHGVGYSPAVGVDGEVYLSARGDRVYAVNPDGTKRWGYYVDFSPASSPAIGADGTVYVGSDYGLYALYPDGTLRWRFFTPSLILSSPAIVADGTVCFGSTNGRLYAIHGSTPLADTPWPKYRHDNANTGRAGGGR